MSAKDWHEDSAHENGNYSGKCSTCSEEFRGHKRRVTCRECATKDKQITTADIAQAFHDKYEHFAPSFGYVTREETREFDADSPNGRLMMAVCEAVVGPIISENKRLTDIGERYCKQVTSDGEEIERLEDENKRLADGIILESDERTRNLEKITAKKCAEMAEEYEYKMHSRSHFDIAANIRARFNLEGSK
ncbi:hypothetical protein KAR91_09205 [Candidatus Pacearchaeota archaeon]|nr:hypothetical protein [Candidatus Pacearchaeota archaeon]